MNTETVATLAQKDIEMIDAHNELSHEAYYYSALVSNLESLEKALEEEIENHKTQKGSEFFRKKLELLDVEHEWFYKRLTQKAFVEKYTKESDFRKDLFAKMAIPTNWEKMHQQLAAFGIKFTKRKDLYTKITNIINLYQTKKKQGSLPTEFNLYTLMENEVNSLSNI